MNRQEIIRVWEKDGNRRELIILNDNNVGRSVNPMKLFDKDYEIVKTNSVEIVIKEVKK